MAKLEFIDHGIQWDDASAIAAFLKEEGIQYGTFPIRPRALTCAACTDLTDDARADLLNEYADQAHQYNGLAGFRQDVIFLHPGAPYYAFLVNKFSALHFHYETEYWYLFGGVGHFGYLGKNGLRFMLHLTAGEFVSVPEGRWQWWAANVDEAFKAMRFFNRTGALTPPNLDEYRINLCVSSA